MHEASPASELLLLILVIILERDVQLHSPYRELCQPMPFQEESRTTMFPYMKILKLYVMPLVVQEVSSVYQVSCSLTVFALNYCIYERDKKTRKLLCGPSLSTCLGQDFTLFISAWQYCVIVWYRFCFPFKDICEKWILIECAFYIKLSAWNANGASLCRNSPLCEIEMCKRNLYVIKSDFSI